MEDTILIPPAVAGPDFGAGKYPPALVPESRVILAVTVAVIGEAMEIILAEMASLAGSIPPSHHTVAPKHILFERTFV
jgi:hypothetical protein